MKITRRKMIELGLVGSGAIISLFRVPRLASAQLGPQIDRFKLPFSIPPVLKPLRSDATTDFYEITMRKSQVEILPGGTTEIWGYNGITPGPTIRQRRDRLSVVRFINDLDTETSIHLHGMASLPQYDGYAEDLIHSGYYKDYTYPNNDASTLWYHDSTIHQTGRNVYMGLVGMYIVEDDLELSLPLPKGEFDVPLILQDKTVAKDGFVFEDRIQGGIYGNVCFVNGVPWPRMEVANRKYRFRILNAGVSRLYQLALSTNHYLIVIGTDGGLCSEPVQVKTLPIGIGERYEVIIDFANYPIGSRVILQNLEAPTDINSENQSQVVMLFEVTRVEKDDSAVPFRMQSIQSLITSPPRTRTFTFGRNRGQWQINGKLWDGNRIDANPRLGDVEIWSLSNTSNDAIHFVHPHLVKFQILDRDGEPPFPYERGWKDVVYLGGNETVRVVMQFGHYSGKYMIDCYSLIQADSGMVAQFEVGRGGIDPMSAPAKPLPGTPL